MAPAEDTAVSAEILPRIVVHPPMENKHLAMENSSWVPSSRQFSRLHHAQPVHTLCRHGTADELPPDAPEETRPPFRSPSGKALLPETGLTGSAREPKPRSGRNILPPLPHFLLRLCGVYAKVAPICPVRGFQQYFTLFNRKASTSCIWRTASSHRR